MSHPRLVEQTAALCTPPPKAATPSKRAAVPVCIRRDHLTHSSGVFPQPANRSGNGSAGLTARWSAEATPRPLRLISRQAEEVSIRRFGLLHLARVTLRRPRPSTRQPQQLLQG